MLLPLRYLFGRIITVGTLVVIGADGRENRFGDGSGAAVVVRFRDRRAERQLTLHPQLALGELYMQGRLEVLEGSIYDLLALIMADMGTGRQPLLLAVHDWWRYLLRRIEQLNFAGRSQRNVKHHYDVGDDIYALFLDDAWQYSCGYFRPGDDLEAAQRAKMRHILAKLDVRAGQSVLDIGSGWGRLAAYIAASGAAEVLGVTLSDNQLAASRAHVRATGIDARVAFEKCDYREIEQRFDRIVSVGMLEHVGVNHYGAYFDKVAELLAENGVALIHTIGRTDGPGSTNPFISKYIFPGGYFPALSELVPAIERSGLIVSDIEVLRLHYADTLRAWRRRFVGNRERVIALKGEDFCRMWEFYLAGSEAGFRFQGLVVYQLQLIRAVGTLPMTRDYMMDGERQLERVERHAETGLPVGEAAE